MIYMINIFPNSNYLSCSSSSGHLLSFDISTLGPFQGIGALISEAPLSGHGKGRPNIDFVYSLSSSKHFQRHAMESLFYPCQLFAIFPISEEKKAQLRNIEK